MNNNEERLSRLTEEQHVPYIVHNFPRCEWEERITPYIKEINEDIGWTITIYGTTIVPYSFLPKELNPEFKVYYNLGDFFENLIDESLWIVISLPMLDIRNGDLVKTWPDSLEDYGNRCEMFNVTDGVIYNEKSNNRDKYRLGYRKEYITPKNSNWVRLNDNDPRISDIIKEYQRILREDGNYDNRLLKLLDYEWFPS